MFKLFLIGLGGFLGASARYGIVCYYSKSNSPIPLETLLINAGGCLIIGLLGGLSEYRGIFSPEVKAFLFVGILGGFTTFSTFSYESVSLFRNYELVWAFLNIFLHVFLGLSATWFGIILSRRFSL